MPLQLCASHRDQLSASLAVRDLNRFNKTNSKEREAHFVDMAKLGKMRIDPFRVAQEMLLKKAVEVRPDLIFARDMHCPCCEARKEFDKRSNVEGWPEGVMPWDMEMIANVAKIIDDEIKARGLKA